jgi:hypothetical protein
LSLINPVQWVRSRLGWKERVRLVARVLPRKSWYRAALNASRLQGLVTGMLGGNRALTEAVMLDNWLWELTNYGPYPIPWTLEGNKVIEAEPERATIFCGVHEPLAEFPLRPYLERGYRTPVVVAHPGRIVKDSQMMVAGLEQRITAIPVDRYVLGRARRLLQQGATVVCLADEQLGAPLSPLIFRLTRLMGARMVFPQAKLGADGTIHVKFIDPPRPYCETDEAIEENMAFLREAQARALSGLGLPVAKVEMATSRVSLNAAKYEKTL